MNNNTDALVGSESGDCSEHCSFSPNFEALLKDFPTDDDQDALFLSPLTFSEQMVCTPLIEIQNEPVEAADGSQNADDDGRKGDVVAQQQHATIDIFCM